MHPIQPAARRLAVNLRVFSLTLLLLTACTVRAQIAGTGSIQGTITDATGAVVTNAPVTISNASTQVQHTTKSDTSGVYTFPNIDVGTYTVAVSVPGFETYEKTGIVLEVGSSISINVNLTVGATNQKVVVKAEGLALQTEDPSFKQTIDQREVTEMPLNGRQMTSLITLSGGAAAAPGGDFTGSKYSYATIAVSIAGGGGNTTQWKLDGGDNNDYMANGNLPFPFPDAVSQFSVESTALGAQDGQHSGGLVNVVTRSGTNSYHGSAFEFIRNNYIDATNFFSTSKDTLHQNQYGGTFGGKIIRDKLFAFAAYQHLKNDQSTASTQVYVPTAANLAGDWSNTDPPPGAAANNCGKPQQLFDPLTGATLPGNKYATAPTYNPQALALTKYLPPINPAFDKYGCGEVSYAIPSEVADNQFVTRVDYTINPKNNLYGRYFIDGYQAPAFFSPTNILITTASGNLQRVQSLTFGEEYTINSNTVNSAHISATRRRNNRGYNPAVINLTTLGVNVYQAEPNGLQLSVASSGKNHGWATGGGTNSVAHFNNNAFIFDDDVTMVRGRHQFVFGGSYVWNQLNISNAFNGNGVPTFNGEYSASGPAGGTLVGDANLDFLQGAMNSFAQSKFQQNALRAPIPSLYFQDTFHASTRLTLVAGLRWEPQFMPVDVFNRGAIFNMSAFLANQISSVYPKAPAGMFFYGDPGVSRQFTKNSPWQWSPNLGASWDPLGNGKTVIRGGLELAYEQVNFFTAQRVQQNAPYATNANPNTSAQLCFSEPWLVGGTGYGCNQVGGTNTSPFPLPEIPTPATAIFPAQSQLETLPTQFYASNTLQWTLSVQRDLSHGWQLQIDYIGNRTNHAPIALPPNPATYIPGNWGANGTGCTGIVTTGPAAVKPGAAGTPCSTTKNQNSRFALTQANPLQGNGIQGGGGGSLLITDTAYSNYNGVVTTLQHRLSANFSLLSNYTFSKCLNIADSNGDPGNVVENPGNPQMDYGRCGSDFRHIFNTVMIARSAFPIHGIAALLANNWELAPLFHIVSGFPLNVTAGSDVSLTDIGNDRPNRVDGVSPYNFAKIRSGAASEATRSYLNQAAFAVNTTPGTYGDVSRNSVSGPMFFQFDSQISRIFPIHERLSLDLRLEAFNVLNHPNFILGTGTTASQAAATSNPASGNFGQITGTVTSPTGARVFQGGVKLSF